MTGIRRVTVLGSGNLGAQIAFRAAFFGFDTTAYDISDGALEAARGRFKAITENYVRDLDDVTEADTNEALDRLTLTSNIDEAVKDADFVIETVPEKPSIKEDTYKKIKDKLKPEAILVTNSSTLLPSDFADLTGRPARYLAMHFANNIHIQNVVEIMPQFKTDEEVRKTTVEFAKEMGMRPVELHREQPGYIINTLLVPWIKGAQTLWLRGVADVATIDGVATAITDNPAFAPFRLVDLVGFGVTTAISSNDPDPQAQEFARRLREDFMSKGLLGIETHHGFYLYDKDGNATGLSDEAKKVYEPFGD